MGQVLSHLQMDRPASLPDTDEVKVRKVLQDGLQWERAEDAEVTIAAEDTHVQQLRCSAKASTLQVCLFALY